MSTPTVSRYRMLRGKSVSEASKTNNNQCINGLDKDNGSGSSSPAHTSATTPQGSPTWRKRSKTQGNFDAQHAVSDIKHFPVPPAQPLKEHGDTTRPRAAVMPLLPLGFGDPSSPTPLGKRQSIIAPVGLAASDEGSRAPGGEEEETGKVEADDPELLAQRLEAETDRILAEQKKRDAARRHQYLVATGAPNIVAASPPSVRTPTRNPVLERLGFLYRTRKPQVFHSPASSAATSIDFARGGQAMEPLLSPRTGPFESPHLATPPLTPLSPVNNDRHIIVCYRGEYVSIPVKTDTSTVDVLRHASEMMTNPINISASIVLESWAPHGLERRLRRYERIHDVLDSWNHDAQSSLLILHSLGPTSDKDLDISSVPATQAPTPGLNLQLHHCTRPGRWHKRWVTLFGDGLLVSSKKIGAGPSDRDSQRLCHLSTYDIYNLLSKLSSNIIDDGQRGSRGAPMRNLKPPKRYVFALKSQQKPTVYTDNATFVHFFCTEDRDVAQEFHDRIHAWRSWYMVRSRKELQVKRRQLLLLGNGVVSAPPAVGSRPPGALRPENNNNKREEDDDEEPEERRVQAITTDPLLLLLDHGPQAPQITPIRHNPRKSIFEVRVSPGHKMRLSVDEAPYTLGAFQPLIDLGKFDKPIDEFGKDWIPTAAAERLSLLLSTTTPGTDDYSASEEATALTTPSSSKGNPAFSFRRDDLVDMASPSEERRRRRDHKRSLASCVDGGAGGDALAQIPAPADTVFAKYSSMNFRSGGGFLAREPVTPPKPEPSPWLPSAAAHTAKARAEQKRLDLRNANSPPVFAAPPPPPPRPVTSTGVAHHNNNNNNAHHNHHHQVFPHAERRSTRGGGGGARSGGGGGGARSGGGGGGGGTQRGNQQQQQLVLPSNLVCHYKAATQWVEDVSSSTTHANTNTNTSSSSSGGPKYLEVPGANNNSNSNMHLRNMPSMPILIESATYGRSSSPEAPPPPPPVPVFWRGDHQSQSQSQSLSLSSAQAQTTTTTTTTTRPSTSGKDHRRPSTSGRDLLTTHSSSSSRRRPSTTTSSSPGGSGSSSSPVFSSLSSPYNNNNSPSSSSSSNHGGGGGEGGGGGAKYGGGGGGGRLSSSSSMRRSLVSVGGGGGGVGLPPGEELPPPMPPVPPHHLLRAAVATAKDHGRGGGGGGRAGAAAAAAAATAPMGKGLLPRSSTTLR